MNTVLIDQLLCGRQDFFSGIGRFLVHAIKVERSFYLVNPFLRKNFRKRKKPFVSDNEPLAFFKTRMSWRCNLRARRRRTLRIESLHEWGADINRAFYHSRESSSTDCFLCLTGRNSRAECPTFLLSICLFYLCHE